VWWQPFEDAWAGGHPEKSLHEERTRAGGHETMRDKAE
jgi:hypothetical protein